MFRVWGVGLGGEWGGFGGVWGLGFGVWGYDPKVSLPPAKKRAPNSRTDHVPLRSEPEM